MKTIPLSELEADPKSLEAIRKVLDEGGLVCVPCNANYRIVADLMSEQAVIRLLQSKHRTQTKPALIFIADEKGLKDVVEDIDPVALKLAKRFWPGSLTILFPLHPELPANVRRQLGRKKAKAGVRVPADPMVQRLVKTFGRPLLVSSANRERKKGASSPAQIRKNFLGHIDLFIDAGDLPAEPASTVVDIDKGQVKITRSGALSEEDILAAQAD